MILQLKTIPITSIQLKDRVRKAFGGDADRELAESLRASGLFYPPLCREHQGMFTLIDGERRIRAALAIGWSEIPVLVAPAGMSDDEALTRELATNLQRSDFNPMERATGIQRLMTQGRLSPEEVAQRLGFSAASVSRSLALLKLPASLQARVTSGAISADAAYMLSRIEDRSERDAIAAQLDAGKMTRDGLARKLKAARRTGERRAAGLTRCTLPLDAGRSITFAGKGLSLDSALEWIEQLLRRARKAKEQGLTLETLVKAMKDQATNLTGAKP